MTLDLCHSKFLKESNEALYASDKLLRPYYQNVTLTGNVTFFCFHTFFVSIHFYKK